MRAGLPRSEAGRAHARQGGFVLAMVVFLLFAISVAGSLGYMVVSAEFSLADANRDGQEALALARSGLERFVAEQLGVVGDSVSYVLGNGIVQVTSRKLAEEDSLNHLYYLRAEASVADSRYPDTPARRLVAAYAWHRLNPLPLKGALWVADGVTRIESNGVVSGLDAATTGDCPGGGTAGTAGLASAGGWRESSGGRFRGNPSRDLSYADSTAVRDTAAIRWDILTNSSFPVDFEAPPHPNFGALPADSFPVTRYTGDVWLDSGESGRGVLIVTGTLYMRSNFDWDGIILAGRIGEVPDWGLWPRVNGMIVSPFGPPINPWEEVRLHSVAIRYHSCNAYAANRSLSYLELVPNTVYEVN